MGNFWDSIKDTAESLGGAVAAPAGAVMDLASMPFDNKDDNFGTVTSALSNRAAAALNPVISPETGLLGATSRGLEAMNWLYINGVSEPLATGNTMIQHVTGVPTWSIAATLGPPALIYGAVAGDHHYGDAFNPDSWAKAYEQANQQVNASGATLAWGAIHPGTDPLSVDNPYKQVSQEHPVAAGGLGWGGEIAAMFGLDPTAAGLKVVGQGRQIRQFARLNETQKANLYSQIVDGSQSGLLRPNLESRTDKYLRFIYGQNPVNRPLSAQEIHFGTPELKRWAKDPEGVAGLLAQAGKLENEGERFNVARRILAVAGGDLSQVARVRAESAEAATIADQLTNMARQGVIDLDALAVAPTLAQNPIFRVRLESQLGNLNKSGAVDKFIDDFIAQNDRLLATQKSLPNLPGAHMAGARAVNRLNDQGLARAPKNALDDWAATVAAKSQSTSSVFQAGKYGVPLVAVRTVGLLASPWTKAPVAVSDALRQPAFTGIASIHDWSSATGQLGAMMRLGKVDDVTRNTVLNEAYLAGTEAQKTAVIEKAERAAMGGLVRWASDRAGHEVSADYITTLMQRGAGKRAESLTSMKGRVYAATEMPDSMASAMTARAGSAARVEDAALGGSGFAPKAQGKWRLDQIDDHGTPLALPVFETQLGNHVPLFDVDLARTAISRHTGHLSRLSKAWEADAKELGRLKDLKAAGHAGLDRAIEARATAVDWLENAGQNLLRVWKFGVLFRLGYPLRVLTDDHMRIISKMGAAGFYNPNLKEWGGNVQQNWGRRAEAKAAMHDLRVRRQEILDELDGNEMAVHSAQQDELTAAEAKLANLKKAAEFNPGDKDLAEQIAHAEAHHDFLLTNMGEYGPNELKTELDNIEAQIEAGTKALRRAKKRVGDNEINLGGIAFPGAFTGEHGNVMRSAASSGNMYDHLLEGAETRNYRSISGGSHQTTAYDDAGHLDIWANVLNNQIASSQVGKFFLEGGSPEEFARWIRQPEQAALRRRVAHFAANPEDWGTRAHGIVRDYVHNDEIRKALLNGRVSAEQLRKLSPEATLRPTVHGRAAADNLGTSHAMGMFGRAMNRSFRWLGEAPTDRLSRHPYFNALYRQHLKDAYSVRRAGGVNKFTQADVDELSNLARKAALRDLKTTLFDLSAHSHAAEVMRFLSPFFGAHQEGVARWWRIAADKPQIVRRFAMVMDVPRYLHLEVDENGDLVKPGSPISSNHRILLQMPQAFGGVDPTDPNAPQATWSISESSFNIILQGGLTNPGAGPLVSMPLDYLAKRYANDPAIAKVARIINPYPSDSPLDNAIPATLKRLSALTYGATGVDPSFGMGIGQREYNNAYQQNLQDKMVDFHLKYNREPTRDEVDTMMEEVGADTTMQMGLRVLWNAGSPAPATPRSKYAVIQQGWYKIQEQARSEGKDFNWAYEQFKAKYGEAYLPLVFSTSNNPGWIDANPADVAAIKHYKGVLQKIDPALSRMVIGAYADDMIEKDATLGEYSIDARNYLRSETIKPGSDQTYYSYDDPATAIDEQMARRGWQKYGQLTASLTALATEAGLNSYEESDQLMALKKAGIAQITGENYAWAREWERGMDRGQFNAYLDDMRQIVSTPVLANDTERTDIKTLDTYLKVRDFFTQVFDARQKAGLGSYEANAQDQLRLAYTAMVHKLVESNTYFEEHDYNGIIERDPLLLREAS